MGNWPWVRFTPAVLVLILLISLDNNLLPYLFVSHLLTTAVHSIMSSDKWPIIAAVGAAAAAAAAAAFGQVIVAAIQAGQQSGEVS